MTDRERERERGRERGREREREIERERERRSINHPGGCEDERIRFLQDPALILICKH